MGPKSNGFGVIGPHAAQLSYIEGQRAHGRCPCDRGIWLVNREFAESHHRQDAVPDSRNDGAAAQRSRRPAAIGGAAGNGAVQPGPDRGTDGARLCLCRRPRRGSEHRDTGTGGSRIGARARGARTAAGDGSHAARYLQQGDFEPSVRDSRISAQAHGSAGAARIA